MRPHRAAAFAVLAGLLVPSAAVACLWDYDTIKMERTRNVAEVRALLPQALEVVAAMRGRAFCEALTAKFEQALA